MKKILIWDLEIPIRNSGGPSGYLFNIKEYINCDPQSYCNIAFLSDLLVKKNSQAKPQEPDIKLKSKYRRHIINLIKQNDYLKIYKSLKILQELVLWYKRIPNSIINDINLNEFDIIHFHCSLDLLHSIDLIKNYKGKIILTSHSPEPLCMERLDLVTSNKTIKKLLAKILIREEMRAWNTSNNLMFPVKDSVEVYYKSNKMKTWLTSNTNKLLFNPSGILNIPININNDLKSKLKIPENAFIVSFIGRHNEVKGYDKLKLFAQKILDKYTNVYFLIGGVQMPLHGLSNDRWIELGWINYGNDLIGISDLFILPNKDTYFDLVTLEVLRIGTPILMSRTGGNKYFETLPQEETTGIYLYQYNDINDQIKQFDRIYNSIIKGDQEKDIMIECNKKIFNNYFTIKQFLIRYQSICSKM